MTTINESAPGPDDAEPDDGPSETPSRQEQQHTQSGDDGRRSPLGAIIGAAGLALIGSVLGGLLIVGVIMMLLVGGIVSMAGGGLGGVLHQSQCQASALAAADIGSVTPVTDFDRDAPFTARVGTWNTLKTNSVARTIAGVEAVGKHADVIGLQEMSPQSRRRSFGNRLPGEWGISDGNNSAQIIYRKSVYQLLAQGSIKVLGVERIENGTAGTSIGPKSLQWVQLRDRSTGGVFFYLNHHIVPDIDRSGHLRTKAAPKRVALYKKQMAAYITLSEKLDDIAPVIGGEDQNFNAKTDEQNKDADAPRALYGAAGIHSGYRELGFPSSGTHGHRYIDWIQATVASAEFVSHAVGGQYGSDHNSYTAVVKKSGTAVTSSSSQTAAAISVSSSSSISSSSSLPSTLTVPGPGGGTMTMNADQVKNAAVIIAQGKANDIPALGWVVALSTAWVESTMNADLDEAQSDRDSAGLFQQRRPWGPLNDRMDPAKSANMFYTGGQGGQRGLLDIPNWEKRAAGSNGIARVAQAVQVSAFPDAYAKWESTARSIVSQLEGSVVPGTAAGDGATNDNCANGGEDVGAVGGGNLGPIDMNAACPLDAMFAPGHKNPYSCNEALAWMQNQSVNPSRSWYRMCLADVAMSYGWAFSGTATAYLAGVDAKRAGVLSTSKTNIPRGAVLYWSNGGAGHVAVYDGEGYIWSNDVVRSGKIDRVPWDFPEKNWGQTWMGWAPPYFPKGGGREPYGLGSSD